MVKRKRRTKRGRTEKLSSTMTFRPNVCHLSMSDLEALIAYAVEGELLHEKGGVEG